MAQANGTGVTVAVLDGKTDCANSDLVGHCVAYAIPGGTYRRPDTHGTHTAGTVAGKNNGVAPGASIINYGVFDSRGYVATGSKLINAWNDAALKGATISSMSFGCDGMALCYSNAELAAMGGASLSSMLFVKAAGNESAIFGNETTTNSSIVAMTALSRIIIVGSVDANGVISSFSNRPGDTCLLASGVSTCASDSQWKYHFIVAPGENIYAAQPNNKFAYLTGTSMATPIVAGAAALLESRWPALKSTPATVAQILFETATDKGAPGVDAVYGWGLLNVAQAFSNQGATLISSPNQASVSVVGKSMSSSSMLGDMSRALKGVVAYDKYGRDFELTQLQNFDFRRGKLANMSVAPAARMSAVGRQSNWAPSFFSAPAAPEAWASFGPVGSEMGPAAALADRSLRLGFNAPTANGGMVQMRLTGDTNARADFAADAALRPLSFFASSELMNQSAFVGYSSSLNGGRDRVMVYALSSRGDGYLPDARTDDRFADTGNFDREVRTIDFQTTRSPRRQGGFGVAYFMQPDERTVVGFNASAIVQKHGLYDISSDLASFDQPAYVMNLGATASREYGDWDVFGAVEMTSLKAPDINGPIGFTSAVLASGEVGVRRSNLLFTDKHTNDALSVSLAMLPTALTGALALDYYGPTADRTGVQAIHRNVALGDITGQVLRLESAYTVKAKDGWSWSLSGGANLNGYETDVAVMGLVGVKW
jgi:hypothetical protein